MIVFDVKYLPTKGMSQAMTGWSNVHDFTASQSDEAYENWFVAQTKPRGEALASQQLALQGFGVFLPRFRKLYRRGRRISEMLSPVFPGYLFVHADPNQFPWRSINGTRGVNRLVGQVGSIPSAVPAAAMQAMFARCNGDLMEALVHEMRPGMQVKLIATAFADKLATIEHLGPDGRVRVLLDLLGQSVSVRVSRSALEPICA